MRRRGRCGETGEAMKGDEEQQTKKRERGGSGKNGDGRRRAGSGWKRDALPGGWAAGPGPAHLLPPPALNSRFCQRGHRLDCSAILIIGIIIKRTLLFEIER